MTATKVAQKRAEMHLARCDEFILASRQQEFHSPQYIALLDAADQAEHWAYALLAEHELTEDAAKHREATRKGQA